MGCINSKKSTKIETQDLQYERVENDNTEEHDAKVINKSQQHISNPNPVTDQLTYLEPIDKEGLKNGENRISDDHIEKLQESIKVDEMIVKADMSLNEAKKEHQSERGEMKSSDKVAEKEFSKYTGSKKYKVSKRSSSNRIEDMANENKHEINDPIHLLGPMKTTRIETLHDKVIGSVNVKETKEYEASEYEGNKTIRIVHTKILGSQSYQTVVMLENDIQKDFKIITDMNEDEISHFQNKWEDLMSSSLIEMINQAKNNMPPREEMEMNEETS